MVPLASSSKWNPAAAIAVTSAVALAAAALPAGAGCSSNAGPDVDWSGCRKSNKFLQKMDLSGSNFERTNLSQTNLKDAKLSSAKMHKADLTKAILRGADMSKANLSGVIGMRAYMNGAILRSANVTKAELYRADLSAVDLSGADLTGAQLGRAKLKNANLDGTVAKYANLARTDLRGASLKGTDLTQAYFFRTRVEGVDLSQTKGLTQDQIALTCGDAKTKLPTGLTAPPSLALLGRRHSTSSLIHAPTHAIFAGMADSKTSAKKIGGSQIRASQQECCKTTSFAGQIGKTGATAQGHGRGHAECRRRRSCRGIRRGASSQLRTRRRRKHPAGAAKLRTAPGGLFSFHESQRTAHACRKPIG